jgi:hypothetical protein
LWPTSPRTLASISPGCGEGFALSKQRANRQSSAAVPVLA